MFELGVLGPLSPFSAGGVQVWWNKGTNVNLWNVPSLGLVCFSTALCCAEEVLLIYYYYEMSQRAVTPLALNQRLPFSRAGLRSCWARVESSLFQGSGSSSLLEWSFPGLPGQCNEQTGGSFLLQGGTGGVSSGNCSCSANSHTQLLETPLLGLQNGLVTLVPPVRDS